MRYFPARFVFWARGPRHYKEYYFHLVGASRISGITPVLFHPVPSTRDAFAHFIYTPTSRFCGIVGATQFYFGQTHPASGGTAPTKYFSLRRGEWRFALTNNSVPQKRDGGSNTHPFIYTLIVGVAFTPPTIHFIPYSL